MASTLAKDYLADRLSKLSEREFRSFYLRLLLDRKVSRDVLRSGISDRRKLADILVTTFTEDGALKMTEEMLKQTESDYKARKTKSHYVDDYRKVLIYRVRHVEPILDELLSRGVIDQDNYDEISALLTSKDKMRQLLGFLKCDEDKDIFCSILEEKDMLPAVAEHEQGPRIERQGSASRHGYQSMFLMHFDDELMAWPFKSSQRSPEAYWIKVEPEVNVDVEDAPIYSLQSEAGHFECSVSGFRWVCKKKVSFRYHFGSWEEHIGRMETMQYNPGGPLINITVDSGKFDEAYLPHWICTEDSPGILDQIRVLHIDTCGDYVEQVSEVTPSHVKLSQPIFSPRGVLMRAGFPVKINCKVLIYKTNKSFLTLHVYLIPRDPALQQTIKNIELPSGSKMIPKPYPQKSLKMRDRFVLSADVDAAEIYPENLKLRYDGCDPNFFEVFIENPDKQFLLTLGHGSVPVWTSVIRQDDYKYTGDFQGKYEEELTKVRSQLVKRVSREVINQLLDDLLKDQVLNDEEKDSILDENNTCADRVRCVVDVVKKKGREASRKLFTHLQSRDPTLCAELGLSCGLPV
ncbi:NACHT, LRR and PYD domains-containing protein 1 homolog [Centropristis striata]|uniref:NACHT, LRR and PYD domains-containing protein 1 homolog n=1 Tax=Centropristis striata TaxID=184440 RepID=UPI0027E08255|nr:NACHT, LRR and PYD domains-containing protein 1 homolog [Centropristis striata]